jgi:type III pantothenate kinase
VAKPAEARVERLVAVDVGNSRVKFGLFEHPATHPPRAGTLPECRQAAAVAVDAPLPWDVLRGWIGDGAPPRTAGTIAGSNPTGVARVLDEWPAEWAPLVTVAAPAGLGLPMSVVQPHRVGIDRALNALAANVVRPAHAPCVIVDTGTATTVDRVSAAGVFEGGAILPGFELCAKALHRYTALLPLIGIEELAAETPAPLGRNTREALRSGLFWGQLGAVRELLARLAPEGSPAPQVLLTGGGAGLLAPHLPQARWEPHLALQGLVLAAARNESGA